MMLSFCDWQKERYGTCLLLVLARDIFLSSIEAFDFISQKKGLTHIL